jgi:hypothetical protein
VGEVGRGDGHHLGPVVAPGRAQGALDLPPQDGAEIVRHLKAEVVSPRELVALEEHGVRHGRTSREYRWMSRSASYINELLGFPWSAIGAGGGTGNCRQTLFCIGLDGSRAPSWHRLCGQWSGRGHSSVRGRRMRPPQVGVRRGPRVLTSEAARSPSEQARSVTAEGLSMSPLHRVPAGRLRWSGTCGLVWSRPPNAWLWALVQWRSWPSIRS